MRKIYSLLATALLLLGSVSAWADAIETIGTRDASTGECIGTYDVDNSSTYTLAAGETYHFSFVNYNSITFNSSAGNWQNWILLGYDGTSKLFALRADNWEDVAGANTGCTSNYNWDTFRTDMDGATVDMQASYFNGIFTMSSTIKTATGTKYTYSYTKSGITATSLDLHFSVNASQIVLNEAKKFSQLYSRSTSTWSSDDVTEWGGNANLAVDATNGLGFNPTNPGTAYSATNSFTIADNAKVKYDVIWYTGNSTGRPINYEYIQFGDKVRISYNNSYNYYLDVTGTSAAATQLVYYKGIRANTISIIFNTATKTVESFVFNGSDITSKVSGTLDGNFNSVTFGFQRGGSAANWAFPNYLTSIVASQLEQSVTTANYTINYKNGETTVKTIESSSAVGAIITADRVVTTDDNVKYLTDDATLPSMTLVAGTNTLDVNVHTPKTATLKVTTTVGTDDPVETTTTLTESDDLSCTWSYAFPLYKTNAAGTYYKTDATTFGESGTFTDGQTIEKTVNYSTADESVVYFADASTYAGTNFTYSNGESGNVAAQNARNRGLYVGTLEAGNYGFIVKTTAANGRSLVLRSGTEDPFAEIFQARTDATGEKTLAFTLSVSTENIYINGANSGTAKTNQSEEFDYAIIRKATTVPATISAAGYATFVSDYNTTPADGVTAYAVKVNGETATLTEVNAIPAKAAVVLKGAEGTYNMTVTSTADALESNELTYSTSAVTADGNQYILANGTQGVGFYKATTGTTIAANKGYLVIDANTAKAFTFAFTGEATAINFVNANVNSDAIYNVAGQKVNNNFKGIVIKNGKKYLNK